MSPKNLKNSDKLIPCVSEKFQISNNRPSGYLKKFNNRPQRPPNCTGSNFVGPKLPNIPSNFTIQNLFFKKKRIMKNIGFDFSVAMGCQEFH
jgi:hypothetical protein